MATKTKKFIRSSGEPLNHEWLIDMFLEYLKTKKKTKISFPIAINTASLEVLCAIPGVGPKMAEKIITYRKTHGPLKKEADLLKISGIGKKKSKIILKSIKFD